MEQPEYQLAQGIIFTIGMFGPGGTTLDVDKIQSTFKRLNFSVFLYPNPNCIKINNLVRATAEMKYPDTYRFIAFYYTGHGGRNEQGSYIVPVQPTGSVDGFVNIEKCIVEPLQHLKLVRLFVFDCCLKPGIGASTFDYHNNVQENKMKRHPSEAMVFATYKGQAAVGDTSNGGLLIHTLCEKLLEEKPLVTTLAETADIVANKRGEDQRPMITFTLNSSITIMKGISL